MDEGRLEAPAGSENGVPVTAEDEAAAGLGAGRRAVAAPVPFRIEMEEDDKDDREEEKDNPCKHDLAAEGNSSRVIEAIAQVSITHDFFFLLSLSGSKWELARVLALSSRFFCQL